MRVFIQSNFPMSHGNMRLKPCLALRRLMLTVHIRMARTTQQPFHTTAGSHSLITIADFILVNRVALTLLHRE